LATHPSFPSFRDHLRLLHLPSFGKFGTLLDCIGRQNLEVCVLLKSIPVIAYQLLVAHYPHALTAIQCKVGNLCLERETVDLREIDVVHFDKLFQCLQSIFKSDFSLLCYTAHVSHHECLIFRKVQNIFIPEFETFVQLYLSYDISGDDRQLEDVGEVLSQLDRIYSFNRATG